MDFDTLFEGINNRAQDVPALGNKLKFNFGDQVLFVDGSGDTNLVSKEDKEADCTITVSLENLKKIMDGELNPMTAVMMGKVKIKGDMSVAMKLQSLLG